MLFLILIWRREWGQAGLAFSSCLSGLLAKMRIDLVNLADWFNRDCGILHLVEEIRPFDDTLCLISSLCCCDPSGRVIIPQPDIMRHFSLPTKIGQVNHIYDAVLFCDASGYDEDHVRILTALLQGTCLPIVDSINLYLRTGSGGDEFMGASFLEKDTCEDLRCVGVEVGLLEGVDVRNVEFDFFCGVDWKGAEDEARVLLKKIEEARMERKRVVKLGIELERIEADERHELQQTKPVKENEEDIKKRIWKAQIDVFLFSRNAYIREQESISAEIDSRRDARDVEMEGLEESIRGEIEKEWEEKMEVLRRRMERVDWSRRRLGLCEKRIAMWEGADVWKVDEVISLEVAGDISIELEEVEAEESLVAEEQDVVITDTPVEVPVLDLDPVFIEEVVETIEEENVIEPQSIIVIEPELIEPQSDIINTIQPIENKHTKLCSAVSWLFDDTVFTAEIPKTNLDINSITSILSTHPTSLDLSVISKSFDKIILARTSVIHVLAMEYIVDVLDIHSEFEKVWGVYLMGDGSAAGAYKRWLFSRDGVLNGAGGRVELWRACEGIRSEVDVLEGVEFEYDVDGCGDVECLLSCG
jgi:hypothetical protein